MSEQVSLDFLISLKQATQNVQQTRKIGGALDYLANLAKRANDALFQTSAGEDATAKYEGAARKKQNQTGITSRMMEATAKVTKRALDLTIAGVRSSIGWWADHAGAMTSFRREMGFASEEVQQFSLGVVRSAAKYGTSMRTVRDLTFFMVRGAQTGQKEMGKLAGIMANLVDFGGADTGTLKSIMSMLAGPNQLMTREGVVQFISSMKLIAQEAKVPFQEIMAGFSSLQNVVPRFTKEGREYAATMLVETSKSLGNVERMSNFIDDLGNQGSKPATLFLSHGGNMAETMERIRAQLQTIRDTGKDVGKILVALRVQTTEQAGQNIIGVGSMSQINDIIMAIENTQKVMGKNRKTFSLETTETQRLYTNNLTPLEAVHKKIKQIKATASGFWESFIGGKGGAMLMVALDKIDQALKAWDLAFGPESKDKDTKAAQNVVKSRFAAINPFSKDPISTRVALLMGSTPELAARAVHTDQPSATRHRKAANDLLAAKFAPPKMGVYNPVDQLRERLVSARSEKEMQELVKELKELVRLSGEGNTNRRQGNTERTRQGHRRDGIPSDLGKEGLAVIGGGGR